jgi:hypothetical protein
MQDLLTWGAVVAAGSSVVAIVTFWMNRGKAEAETRAKAEGAASLATSALAKCDLLASQLTDARLETAREYVTAKDLAAAEMRLSGAVDGLRQEVRGMNERLDRMLEKHSSRDGCLGSRRAEVAGCQTHFGEEHRVVAERTSVQSRSRSVAGLRHRADDCPVCDQCVCAIGEAVARPRSAGAVFKHTILCDAARGRIFRLVRQ